MNKKPILSLMIITLFLVGCANKPEVKSSSTLMPSKPLSPTLSPEPDSSLLKIVGQIGGSTRAVEVQGNYAYVGVGYRLTILDVTDLNAPREIGVTIPLDGKILDIAVSGSYAYVAAGGGGFYVVDTSAMAQPGVVGRYDTQGYAEDVKVKNNYAYIADGPGGLRIVDITDPTKPEEVSTAYNLNYIINVALDGSYVYLAAAGAGMLVANVSDPANPTEVSSYDTPGYAYGITSAGSTVYIADGWEGLQVLDVSNPRQPESIGSYDTPGWAMDLIVVGDSLYIADAFGGLRVLNVSDRVKPTEVGSYQLSGCHAAKVAVSGNTTYLADIYLGVQIVDVSQPVQPSRLGLYNPVGYVQAVTVTDGYAYVAAGKYGFRVIDVADPRRPREVAAIATKESAVTVVHSGTTAYVADYGMLYVIDISNPLQLKLAHTQPLTGHSGITTFQDGDARLGDMINMVSRSLFIQGTTLYNAGEWGLLLLDISNPSASPELSFIQTSPSSTTPNNPVAVGVAVNGNVAYLAVGEAGLYTIDVSNSTHPALLGVFDEPAPLVYGKKNTEMDIVDVVVVPPLAYLMDHNLVRVIDVSDPVHLKELASYTLPIIPTSSSVGWRLMATDGNKLFVADGAAGLFELDVTDPANPKLVGELRLPGLASWVFLDKGYVYVADGEGGLFIIQRMQDSALSNKSSVPQDELVTVEGDFSPSYAALQISNADLSPAIDISVLPSTMPTSIPTTYPAGDTHIVVRTEDSGSGTLRECLQEAESGDTITFDAQVFPPKSPVVIRVASQLPGLNQGSITLDASNAGVILDGGDALSGTVGLPIGSNQNVVMGLQILHFSEGIGINGHHNIIGGDRSHGIGPMGEGNLISGNKGIGINVCCRENATNNRIVGNFIGTDISGADIHGNWDIGIAIGGILNTIGGRSEGERNIISGNGTTEIELKGASGNLIVGNYVGLDASGRNKLGKPTDVFFNIWAGSFNNRVERNVIAGSLRFTDPGTSFNEVVGNYIGTDASGTVAISNEAYVSVELPFNRIGGTRPGEGNVINGIIVISRSSDVLVMGNLINTKATGKEVFPRATGWSVILGDRSSHNFIGGTTEAERNVINGPKGGTLVHLGDHSNHNFIVGNYIGTDISGTMVMPNLAGIEIEDAEFNTIQRNLIIGGAEYGISLSSFDWDKPGANYNWIKANLITKNEKAGIGVGNGEGNIILYNDFIMNGYGALDRGQNNKWDDGSRGNFWGDYTGEDLNKDGIGDSPYLIKTNGADNRPVMMRYGW